MGIKMADAPVFYTLAQIKFNRIEKMGDAIPDIQDKFRKDYPDFKVENKKEFHFRFDPTNPGVETRETPCWSFSNAERTEGYVLLSDSLVFHTASYTSFHEFLEKCIKGFEIIHEVIELSFVERVGLRYLNSLQPQVGDDLNQYLNHSLLGLSSALDAKLVHNVCETVFEVAHGKLVFKSLIKSGALALPPDIQPNLLKFNIKSPQGKNATVDIDFFVEKRDSINIENIRKELVYAHDVIESVFQKTISDYARRIWG